VSVELSHVSPSSITPLPHTPAITTLLDLLGRRVRVLDCDADAGGLLEVDRLLEIEMLLEVDRERVTLFVVEAASLMAGSGVLLMLLV
jgi:hypothetical protein